MLAQGDAVGSHAMWIKEHLRSRGCQSEIFVGDENSATSQESFNLDEVDRHILSRDDTLLLYHVAQASPCADFLATRQEPL